jgi:anti-anti-sigma regulatory factor
MNDMSYEWGSESETPVLFCSGEIGHIECGNLRTEILKAIESSQDLNLDLSGVTDAGTMFVQLTISAKIAAEAKGLSMNLLNASASILSAFERTGVEMGA